MSTNLLQPASAKSLLIVGCGYLGRRVALLWQNAGNRVAAVTRNAEKAAELQRASIEPVLWDIGSLDVGPSLPATDVVLWSVGLDRTSASTRRDVWINGLQRVLDRIKTAAAPPLFVYCSSTSVYGDHGGDTVDELSDCQPQTESGACCLEAEQLVRTYGEVTGQRTVILRLAGLYGPDRLLRRLDELRQAVPIAADPDAWLNLVHVNDAAAIATHVCLAHEPPPLLNVVSSVPVTRRQYYSTLAKLTNSPTPVFEESGLHVSPVSTVRRGSSGNRRVTSRVLNDLGIPTQFDDTERGLKAALDS